MSVRPIFLLSLPRAGSTLTQRVIASHPAVATASEPWVLLPLFYALREEGARAEYWHRAAALAIADFCAELPDVTGAYRREAAALARRLYERAAGPGARCFLDKTPHYHLIARELLEAFDDARFVFLWRNPLAVAASLLESFRAGRWEPGLYRTDLFNGVANLTAARRLAGARACAARYEDLVTGEEPWRRLFGHLELEFDPAYLEEFTSVELRGRYGDRKGGERWRGLSSEPAERWRGFFANPVRRRWARRYLDWIGEERLAVMGYERAELEKALATAGNSRRLHAPLDLVRETGARRRAAGWRRNLERLDSPLLAGQEGLRARLRARR